MTRILIMGRDSNVREAMARELAANGNLVVVTGNPALIGELLTTLEPELVLLNFPGNGRDERQVASAIRKLAPLLPVLAFNGHTKEAPLEIPVQKFDGRKDDIHLSRHPALYARDRKVHRKGVRSSRLSIPQGQHSGKNRVRSIVQAKRKFHPIL
jgi:DNA-binding NtrC family response regulator